MEELKQHNAVALFVLTMFMLAWGGMVGNEWDKMKTWHKALNLFFTGLLIWSANEIITWLVK